VGLGKSFRIIDDDKSFSLDRSEFFKALKDYRISSDPREVEAIFNIFDQDNSGKISYNEFIRQIVGEMNVRRQSIAKRAFTLMDVNGNGVIEISDIKQRYNAKKHPDVLLGKRSEDDVLYEFLDTFEEHYALKHPESKDRKITLPEWLEYYNHVSCSIDNDDYFEAILVSAYGFDKP